MQTRAAYGRALSLATRARVQAHTAWWRPAFGSFGRRSRVVPPFRGSGLEHVRIGDDVYLGLGSWLRTEGGAGVAPVLRIGAGCRTVGNLTISVVSSVVLGERVSIARNVYIADHTHSYDRPGVAVRDQGIKQVASVRIDDHVWLGQSVVVGPGVHIGTGAVVAAGSLVREDVPAYSLVAGSPAVVVRCWAPTPDGST